MGGPPRVDRNRGPLAPAAVPRPRSGARRTPRGIRRDLTCWIPTRDEADHPDPVPQRRGPAPHDARRPPAHGRRLRPGRVAGDRRRLHRPHVEVARATASTTSCGSRTTRASPTRSRLVSTPRSSSAPTSSSTPTPTTSTTPTTSRSWWRRSSRAWPTWSIGDRQVADRRVLPAQEAAAAHRELGRPPGVRHRRAGCHVRFRAYNREAALALTVVSKFTYTLESLIQAGKSLVAVKHVPVGTNPKMRESRLFGSMWAYIRRNTVTIFRIYTGYEPLRVFTRLACCSCWRRSPRSRRSSTTGSSRDRTEGTCSR